MRLNGNTWEDDHMGGVGDVLVCRGGFSSYLVRAEHNIPRTHLYVRYLSVWRAFIVFLSDVVVCLSE